MKGVILAGGTGSRLSPLTDAVNKHLLPVGHKPMLYHVIEKFVTAGISDIMITTGTEHAGDIFQTLGSGKKFGAKFTYRVQDEAGGIAQALSLVEEFVHDDKFMVILGDNLFQDDLGRVVKRFEEQEGGARVLLKRVNDPERFGVATVDEAGAITKIVEKPTKPESHMAVTGCYLYHPDVFDVVKTLKPSGRGELEITDVNMHYVKSGNMFCDVLQGWWTDAGTFESLKRAQLLVERL